MRAICIVGVFVLAVFFLAAYLRYLALRDAIKDPLDIEDRL